MPIEKWSDTIAVAHMADDPQFTEDALSVEAAVESGIQCAVLDFAAVRFVNSSNLARLLKLRKVLGGEGQRLVLCSLSTQVWGAFLVTGLDKVFEFSDNVPTALATVQIA